MRPQLTQLSPLKIDESSPALFASYLVECLAHCEMQQDGQSLGQESRVLLQEWLLADELVHRR